MNIGIIIGAWAAFATTIFTGGSPVLGVGMAIGATWAALLNMLEARK